MAKEDKGARYSPELWEAIYRIWRENENVSYAKAAQRAAEILQCDPPSKSAVTAYALRNQWKRGGNIISDTGKAPDIGKKEGAKRAANMSKIIEEVNSEANAAHEHVRSPGKKHGRPECFADLSDNVKRFVDEYLVDLNGTQAVIRAGYAKGSARQTATRLLTNAVVAAEIARRQKMLSEKTEITHEMVLERYWMIATANPNDLAQYRRENCRHCWGDNHLYQWTLPEYEAACLQAKEDGLADPPEAGGFDFDPTRPPHPDCPQCRGEGVGRVFVTDTRKLTPQAAALYAGVKLGKDGLEVKTHNQLAALEAVGRHIGFFKDKVEVSTGDFDPAKLGAIFGEAMAKSRAMTEAMRRDRESSDQ